MKLLIIALTAVLLTGCGLGDIIDPSPNKYPIESTSTSANPGTLEAYAPATIFESAAIVANIENRICLPETKASDCLNNQANMQNDFGFNIAQVKNNIKVTAYTVQYNTPGAHNENRSVSGGVLVPNLPESQIKGIVLYFHPTEISKTRVPSCFNNNINSPAYCVNQTSDYGEFLSGMLASQGYIVVMPDYVGQGFDAAVIHPYIIYPEVNALSGINMLIATNSLLTTKLNPNFSNNIKNLYITGFSEGGSYAIWATKILQDTSFLANNHLELKDTVGLSGAYDLVNSQLAMESANLVANDLFNTGNVSNASVAKPVLVSYLLSAYGFYELDQTYNSLFQADFLKCRPCIFDHPGHTIPDLLNDRTIDDNAIKNYLASSAALTGYMVNGNNSAKALIETPLLTNPQFLAMLSAASITKWTSNTPVAYGYLTKDSLVTNLNSAVAISQTTSPNTDKEIAIEVDRYKYMNKSLNNENTEVIDHLQSEVFLMAAALKEFESN